MANPNNPFGFRSYQTLTSAGYTAKTFVGFVEQGDTLGYWEGDVVKLAASGDSIGNLGVIRVAPGDEDTDIPLAVVSSIQAIQNPEIRNFQGTPLALENVPIPATKTKDYYIHLIGIDAQGIFEIQDDGLNALTATAIGSNANYTAADGNSTQLGFSKFMLDSSSVATTAALPLTIIGVSSRTPEPYQPYTVWLVKFNVMQFLQNNAGV